jgi:hypothetical protein
MILVISGFGLWSRLRDKRQFPTCPEENASWEGTLRSSPLFYPVNGEPFKVLLYVATSKNPLWLGEAQVSDIANQNRGVSRTEWLQRGVRFAIGELHEAPLSRLRRPTSVQSRSGGFKESRREEYVSYDPHGRR